MKIAVMSPGRFVSNSKGLVLALVGLTGFSAGFTQCSLTSSDPLYTDDTVGFESELLGTWTTKDGEHLTVQQGRGRRYKVIYSDFDPLKPVEVHLVRLGYRFYVDVFPEDTNVEEAGFSNPTIREFSREYLGYCRARNRRPDFKKQALVSILRILGSTHLHDFRRRHAIRFIEKREREGVSPATINRGLAVVKHMLNVALDREYIDVNLLARFKKLPEVQEALRILTYEEYRQLIETVTQEDPVIGGLCVASR